MNALRLTPEAKADLAEIRRFGVKRWGAKQARSYLSSMGVAFRRAADDPKLVPVAGDVGSNYRRGRFGSHLFFFVEEPGGIAIVRVLHVRMRHGRHLKSL